jgi:predicted nucleic acid-binding protein
MIYLDSSLVVKLYVLEANSQAVIEFVGTRREPMVATRHLRLEVQTAIRQRVFDQNLAAAKARQAIFDFNRDAALRYVFEDPALDMHEVYGRALHLSRDWADTLGVRTLDILHVASALELRLGEFVTGDKRQAELAEKCGLIVTRL